MFSPTCRRTALIVFSLILAYSALHADIPSAQRQALIALYKDDPAQSSKVKDYQNRLARLAKSKPAPARPVKGNS